MSEEASTDNSVLTERRGRILIITINRPEAKNSVNAAVSHGLAAATDQLDDDPALSVGILTGAGGSFCAGMDLKAFARGENVVVRVEGWLHRTPTGQADHRRCRGFRAGRRYGVGTGNGSDCRSEEFGLRNP